jgi:uncharacterized membrane protein
VHQEQAVEIAVVALVIADLYLIVYYRLMVGYYQARNGAPVERGGILRALTPPARSHLKPHERKYLRRYWIAVAGLAVLVATGVWLRYPVIAGLTR